MRSIPQITFTHAPAAKIQRWSEICGMINDIGHRGSGNQLLNSVGAEADDDVAVDVDDGYAHLAGLLDHLHGGSTV